ncbi:MAG: selenide, water dikinase SelD [Chloroflexi bacterium]|nr:MAG: selenide, water dikinase SelD [Chloroflexota bacterium]TME70943.1 MAG: selenide, water dikinase SelD [Chloroflexota bacterium]TMG48777.1 MAG: selenide, water dikinase SelD [Chloroflexota bacterium]
MRAQKTPAELIVGLDMADDAAVYLVARDLAIVETLDFFPPIVDDAYASGSIGAANAMSDVYAMGGEVLFALNIAAWPEDAPLAQLERVFQGAIDKVAEAGGAIAGGHTVIDREPKYGLAVTGRVHPERMLLKAKLRVGDALWLTKAIGTGVLTTAHKNGSLDAADLASAIASMVTLNRAAAQAAVDAELHAATDITGFGLGGHAYEMAQQSSVAVRIRASLVPLLPGARGHAETGISFGGLERNRSYFDDETKVRFEGIEVVLRTLMLDPQTSGGLLVGVPPAHATAWQRACDARGVHAIQIGEVVAGDVGVNVVS